jgi:tRNA (cmo5U34)-methyltransferase
MTNEFDIKAREWDKNQLHLDRSEAIATALKNTVPLKPSMKALEFGAGTGLLSFLVYKNLHDITLVDTSSEMIRVLKEKILEQDVPNMRPLCMNLEQEDLSEKYDLIFSQMVFHHVEQVGKVLAKFYDMLNPGGYVAIADLYPEDGSFHGDGFTGHKGFDPVIFGQWLAGHSFRNVSHQHCYTLKKMTDSGMEKEYPIFLLTARK